MLKITFKPNQRKMGKEELQAQLKSKTQSGSFTTKKDYNRKDKSWKREVM